MDPIRKLTCAWKMERDLAVCSGMRTRTRNCLCSDFKGSAKPFMMLPETRRSKFGEVFYICTKETNSSTQETHLRTKIFSGDRQKKWCFYTQMLNITQLLSTLGGTSAAPAALLLNTDRAGLARSSQRSLERRRCGKLLVSVFYLFFPRLASVRPRPTGCRCMWAEL